LVELRDLAPPEARDPGPVVKGLGHDLSGGLVSLELDGVQRALAVHGQQIDPLAEGRGNLPPEDQEDIQAEDGDVRLENLFEPRLVRQWRGRDPGHLAVDPPDTHLNRHLASHRPIARSAAGYPVHKSLASTARTRLFKFFE
jgi:hypothetical protein